jgi:hypothetical protein
MTPANTGVGEFFVAEVGIKRPHILAAIRAWIVKHRPKPAQRLAEAIRANAGICP